MVFGLLLADVARDWPVPSFENPELSRTGSDNRYRLGRYRCMFSTPGICNKNGGRQNSDPAKHQQLLISHLGRLHAGGLSRSKRISMARRAKKSGDRNRQANRDD
ncbi:MAG TPA: hypothetical protein VHC39_00625 [Rhizomicrobium sp.]|nr:hypothetical protein [Rhizomicrobium sp.]